MTMIDNLTSLSARFSHTDAKHDIIQTKFKHFQKIFSSIAFAPRSVFEKLPKLLFSKSVGSLYALLHTKLGSILCQTHISLFRTMHSRRIFSPAQWTLNRSTQ